MGCGRQPNLLAGRRKLTGNSSLPPLGKSHARLQSKPSDDNVIEGQLQSRETVKKREAVCGPIVTVWLLPVPEKLVSTDQVGSLRKFFQFT